MMNDMPMMGGNDGESGIAKDRHSENITQLAKKHRATFGQRAPLAATAAAADTDEERESEAHGFIDAPSAQQPEQSGTAKERGPRGLCAAARCGSRGTGSKGRSRASKNGRREIHG